MQLTYETINKDFLKKLIEEEHISRNDRLNADQFMDYLTGFEFTSLSDNVNSLLIDESFSYDYGSIRGTCEGWSYEIDGEGSVTMTNVDIEAFDIDFFKEMLGDKDCGKVDCTYYHSTNDGEEIPLECVMQIKVIEFSTSSKVIMVNDEPLTVHENHIKVDCEVMNPSHRNRPMM
jgi:hypothetical protein